MLQIRTISRAGENDVAVGRVAERDDCALEGAEPGQGGERGVDLVERAGAVLIGYRELRGLQHAEA